ncbi:MAG: DUF4111 domain-containing protein [Lachnospiraceae bacterium]|nr:DUF4111 domain-containing protein [Lachnospiraceae bacterium]
MEDLRVKRILEQVRQDCAGIFGKNLVGVYVHGSIAFGCFCWENSDIDFLVVTREAPGPEEKEALIRALLELDVQCPQKGLEMSLVLERYCRDFIYPTPFELHFSNAHKAKLFVIEKMSDAASEEENGKAKTSAAAEEMHGEIDAAEGAGNCGKGRSGNSGPGKICEEALREYCRSMNGTDKDLAAHFTVLRAVGFALCGREISDVFGEVPREAYLDSIWSDIAGAADEIAENPVYVILNLCRVLAFLEDGLVCSKAQGGAWALGRLPEDFAGRGLIEEAVECYRTGKRFAADREAWAERAAAVEQAEPTGSAELAESAASVELAEGTALADSAASTERAVGAGSADEAGRQVQPCEQRAFAEEMLAAIRRSGGNGGPLI